MIDHRKASREEALALGWSAEDIDLAEALTRAVADAIVGMAADTGQPMVKIDILHCALGAVLEQSFVMMPDNECRSHFLDHFIRNLVSRISTVMAHYHVPEGTTRQ